MEFMGFFRVAFVTFYLLFHWDFYLAIIIFVTLTSIVLRAHVLQKHSIYKNVFCRAQLFFCLVILWYYLKSLIFELLQFLNKKPFEKIHAVVIFHDSDFRCSEFCANEQCERSYTYACWHFIGRDGVKAYLYDMYMENEKISGSS